jgi:glycosyltransferase involved in cell wall biosynthesis
MMIQGSKTGYAYIYPGRGYRMITISLCMIVKNEEKILARCLDSIADLVDEIIVVDTGSEDGTKREAARYGAAVYDFPWTDDFAAARNFAFSKAGCEYIYSADADEVLSEENRQRFRLLKENLLAEIEIVQMKYGNQLSFGTVYNFDEEYRPKLFKRLRGFVWEEPIHETVRLAPVVYDSDIVITHLPAGSHAGRDLENFRRQWESGRTISKRLHGMYARELFLAGNDEDFLRAAPFFEQSAADAGRSAEEVCEACCVAAHAARAGGDTVRFFKYALKVVAGEANSEICCEIGAFFEERRDFEEAAVWYYNAVYETSPVLRRAAGREDGLDGLIRCYEALGCDSQVQLYRREREKE